MKKGTWEGGEITEWKNNRKIKCGEKNMKGNGEKEKEETCILKGAIRLKNASLWLGGGEGADDNRNA